MTQRKFSRQRRRRGEGSFYVRKDGRHVWEGKVLGVKQQLYGASYEAVKDARDRLLGNVANGLPMITGNGSAGEFLHEWLISIRRAIRSKTYESYERTVRVHLVPRLGSIVLRKLTPTHITELIVEPLEKDAPRTAAYCVTVLRRALKAALRWERVARNVAELVDIPRHEKRAFEPYSDEEFNLWLDALEGHPYRALFLLGGTLGLRKGEASGLREADVDFETGEIRLEQQVQLVRFDAGQRLPGAGELRLVPLKTAKSRRLLRVGAELLAALKEARRQKREWQLKAGEHWNDAHDLLFTTRTGAPLNPTEVLRMHYRIVKKADLRADVTFHGLRHQAATDLRAAGMEIDKVSNVLGHSSVRTTSDIYVKTRLSDADIEILARNGLRRVSQK